MKHHNSEMTAGSINTGSLANHYSVLVHKNKGKRSQKFILNHGTAPVVVVPEQTSVDWHS